jgi:riboflavin kinase/FMN adenylyltransferase
MGFQYLEDYVLDGPLAVCIGVFDGVHRGHQALLSHAASVQGAISAAFTFDPHPAAVFAPARVPEMLGTLTERAALLRHYGAERVVVARFDRAFAAQTPAEFIEHILVEKLRAKAVIIGDDFRFGCDRTGNVDTLRAAGDKYGFTVDVVPPVFVQGVPARSTAIRQMLNGGEAEEASRLLGRPYRLAGEVVPGRKLGRTIGFPTANLETPKGILVPAAGVYAGIAELPNGEHWRAAISIGTNPTVAPENHIRTVEAFLMDGFDGDLYDQTVALHFHAFLRPTLKFDSIDALIEQMRRDVAEAALRVCMP